MPFTKKGLKQYKQAISKKPKKKSGKKSGKNAIRLHKKLAMGIKI